MIYEAINHVPLSNYAYALDEENIVIRLRVARDDMSTCRCFYGDRSGEHSVKAFTPVVMECAYSDELFDYYEARIKSLYSRVCYFFELNSVDGDYAYYHEYGLTTEMDSNITTYFQMPYIHRADVLRQPQWTYDLVIYHIFPDSFATDHRFISCQGKDISDEKGYCYSSKLGGTLNGIRKNIDYLLSIGVNCIYLNPIFKSGSYHKYNVFDYYEIDPCLGTNEDFKELVKQCHENGIRIILDGVFNHSGLGFFAFEDIIKNGEKSRYVDWYYDVKFPLKTTFPASYSAFAYEAYMPKLNTANPEVQEYFCQVGKYWVEEMGIDGWRLDVANEVNHDFWRAFRKAVRSVKEDALLIGEVWENGSVWLMGDQFDSTMNYAFYNTAKAYFALETMDAERFSNTISNMYLRYSETIANMQMNFIDTHDVARYLSFCKGNIERLKMAVVFLMTYPGLPSVFYGDECGAEGIAEADYRQPMPWSKIGIVGDFYTEMIKLRKSHSALQTGRFRILAYDVYEDVVVYERFNDEESVVITLNRGNLEYNIEIK